MTLIREDTWYAVALPEGHQVVEEVSLRVLATICLSLETTSYSLVQDAKEAWEKMQNAFQDYGLIRKIGLLRKLTSMSLDDSGSVESYVDELMSTAHKLARIGFKVDNSTHGWLRCYSWDFRSIINH